MDAYGHKLGRGISAPSDQPSRSTKTSGKALRWTKAKRNEFIATILPLSPVFSKPLARGSGREPGGDSSLSKEIFQH